MRLRPESDENCSPDRGGGFADTGLAGGQAAGISLGNDRDPNHVEIARGHQPCARLDYGVAMTVSADLTADLQKSGRYSENDERPRPGPMALRRLGPGEDPVDHLQLLAGFTCVHPVLRSRVVYNS